MSWKKCSVMEEGMKFVAKCLDGHKMTDLCKEFGIPRKTGYKIFNRFKECGFEGLIWGRLLIDCLLCFLSSILCYFK